MDFRTWDCDYAPVAQGTERWPPEPEVAGSNPAGRTSFQGSFLLGVVEFFSPKPRGYEKIVREGAGIIGKPGSTSPLAHSRSLLSLQGVPPMPSLAPSRWLPVDPRGVGAFCPGNPGPPARKGDGDIRPDFPRQREKRLGSLNNCVSQRRCPRSGRLV